MLLIKVYILMLDGLDLFDFLSQNILMTIFAQVDDYIISVCNCTEVMPIVMTYVVLLGKWGINHLSVYIEYSVRTQVGVLIN